MHEVEDHRHPIQTIDPSANERVALFQGDIVTLHVDVTVNCASSDLTVGHGVCQAVHLAAGTDLLRACSLLVPCDAGYAKVTAGFLLPSTAVFHVVGPRLDASMIASQHECELLRQCYEHCLVLTSYSRQLLMESMASHRNLLPILPARQYENSCLKTILE